jgi:Zn finger protein HypA/HybF involved in hydrogenase expression
MSKKYTAEQYIKKARQLHGDAYDYSKILYKDIKTKVLIICKACRTEFLQSPTSHISGHGCPYCKGKIVNVRPRSTEEFIDMAKTIHGDRFDYSKTIYVGWTIKTEITCKKHGSFFQTPNEHMRNRGCPKCRYDTIAKARRLTTQEFIDKSNLIHDCKYDYSKVVYKSARQRVNIICREHGDFMQTPDSHIAGHGCPRCNVSSGERAVTQSLKSLGIPHEQQKEFEECRDKHPLRFDFYFEHFGTRFLVEYQGIQHTKPIAFFEKKRKQFGHKWFTKHDQIKRIFAKKYGFVLIEVPHTVKDISNFLMEQIQNRIEDKQQPSLFHL